MNVKKNYIFNTINRISKVLIAVITVPYVSRVLGSSNIGIYSYTYTVATYFVLFIMLGLENYGNREIAKNKHNKDELNRVFSEIYLMQVIIGFIVLMIYFVYSFMSVDQYTVIFRIQSVYVFGALLDVNWALCGLEEFEFTSIRNIILNVVSLILILFFVNDKSSLFKYTLILCVVSLLNNCTGWIYIRRHIRLVRVERISVLKRVLPNIVLFIPVFAVSLYKMMDKIMMGMMTGINQVGLYESAEKIIQIPTLLISSLGTVMLPRMSSLYSLGMNDDARDYLKKSINISMLLSTSLCFGIMGISKEFVPIFYGRGFSLCSTLYLILLPCCIFLAFSNVIRTQFLIPKSKDKIYITAVISGAIVNMILNVMFIPKFGAVGAAIGTFIAEITVCVIQTIAVREYLPIKNYLAQSILYTLLGTLMFLIIYFIKFNISLLLLMVIKVVLGGIVYIVGFLFIQRRQCKLQHG